MMTLEQLIDIASDQAEQLFKKHGQLAPVYRCFSNGDQKMFLIPAPTECSKDEGVALMKAFMLVYQIERFVFTDEAWMIEKRDGDVSPDVVERWKREGLEHEPGRVECVIFLAEDKDSGSIQGRRIIHRPAGKKPYLGPLETERFDTAEGRMVGLLPAAGRRQ